MYKLPTPSMICSKVSLTYFRSFFFDRNFGVGCIIQCFNAVLIINMCNVLHDDDDKYAK